MPIYVSISMMLPNADLISSLVCPFVPSSRIFKAVSIEMGENREFPVDPSYRELFIRDLVRFHTASHPLQYVIIYSMIT